MDMNWIERWSAISARADGLIEAAELLARLYSIQQANTGMVRQIMLELIRIQGELRSLLKQCKSDLPEFAAAALEEYCSDQLNSDAGSSGDAVELQPIVKLKLFCARFSYLVRDSEIEARNATELAFEHLQRLIAVDEQVREKWVNAFGQGEVSCERLGAVHLLAHGIWAFKAKGERAETDLVYGDTELPSRPTVRRIARAMVATEWKIVRGGSQPDNRAREARLESKEYAADVLGDLELKRTRYIVLVSNRQLRSLPDVYEDGICYRHILLAVDPEIPSRAARKSSSAS